MSGELVVVVGGQFGSEGKGAVVAHLSSRPTDRPRAVARVAGPNAGHSAVGVVDGGLWALRQVPIGAVTDLDARLVICAGSEVEPAVLWDEVSRLDAAGYRVSERLYVDRAATILTDGHKSAEADAGLVGRIGSTGKGIGAARAARAMRTADTAASGLADLPGATVDTLPHLRGTLARGGQVIVEGTQGYGLGLHTRYYPKTTSSDCRAVDFLAMSGLSPWDVAVSRFRVLVAMRPNPIRVAGDSGPLLGETTWDDLGLEPELTTVTRKVRRVGEWDPVLAREAVVANGGYPVASIALTMADHAAPEIAGRTGRMPLAHLPGRARGLVEDVERDAGARVVYLGTGPGTAIDIEALP